jgi:hypothetical protein
MHALAFLTVTAAERGTSAYGQLSRTRQRHDQHVAAGAADLIALTAAEIRRLRASAPGHAAPMTITCTGHAGAVTTRPAPENPTTSDEQHISACGCRTRSGCHSTDCVDAVCARQGHACWPV